MFKKWVSSLLVVVILATMTCTSVFADASSTSNNIDSIISQIQDDHQAFIAEQREAAQKIADQLKEKAASLDLSKEALENKKGAIQQAINEKIVEAMVKIANKNIEIIVDNAIKKGDNITSAEIKWVVDTTNAIAKDVIERAAKLGVVVTCEYEAVQLGDQIVMIDPLRVIRA